MRHRRRGGSSLGSSPLSTLPMRAIGQVEEVGSSFRPMSQPSVLASQFRNDRVLHFSNIVAIYVDLHSPIYCHLLPEVSFPLAPSMLRPTPDRLTTQLDVSPDTPPHQRPLLNMLRLSRFGQIFADKDFRVSVSLFLQNWRQCEIKRSNFRVVCVEVERGMDARSRVSSPLCSQRRFLHLTVSLLL